MTQLALSDDLPEITAEINIYKQQAGQAVFEIGRRLKHVRENDLAHGQWIAWLESIDIVPRTAQRMIQAYEQFGNTTHASHLPSGKIFEMLSLPESVDRQQFVETPHVVPSTGETKTVNDMSRNELREVKKALQDAERRADQAENEKHHFQKLWNQEKQKPAQIVYREDTAKVNQLQRERDALQDNLKFVNQQLETTRQLQETYKKDATEYQELRKKIEFLHREKADLSRQIESATAISGLSVEIDNFIKTKLAPIRYSRALERLDSEVVVRNLSEIIGAVEQWCEDMRRYLPKNNRKVVIDYDPAG